jgi:diguanylate cyclase (GGDEF)-like protein
MALTNQLDFIFFFYGLAFILLGTVCFAIARGHQGDTPWGVLGVFAYLHGVGEWLDLSALIVGDVPVYAIARTALMTASFVFLAEFARLEARRTGFKISGPWIFLPLILVPVAGGLWTGDLNTANALARYALGLPAALGTSLVLVLHVRTATGSARAFAIAAAAGFALYAGAAGLVVPEAPFWPASLLNYGSFSRVIDMPVQFVRGLLACSIAFSIWAFWGQQLIRTVASSRYTRFMRQQFFWTLATMAAILMAGWMLTDYLGGIYKQNIQTEARGDLDLVSSRLAGETAMVDGMVKALAGDPSVHALLAGVGRQADAAGSVDAVLSLHLDAAGAEFGCILDRSGAIVATSDKGAARDSLRSVASSAYFQKAVAGEAGHDFEFDRATVERSYTASYPIRGEDGNVIGVAVLAKPLDAFERDLLQFERPVFLIDPHGVVALTNRPAMMLHMLWPLPDPVKPVLARQFGALAGKPMLGEEVADGNWVTIDGTRDYVRRRFAANSDWSVVLLTVSRGIFASRVLGIIITLQMATLTLVYLVGRERWIYDHVQMGKRLKLEEMTRSLDVMATTDSLTGLYNRSKFNQQLAVELLRVERYRTPLSLVLFDIDHFKRINDTLGHQAGDAALVHISRFVSAHIRTVDVLARWGGEEFVILAPGSDAAMAGRLAENLRDAMQRLDIGEAGRLTCSFGVAQYFPGDTAEALIGRADDALYRAKLGGRNRVELAAMPADKAPALHSVA